MADAAEPIGYEETRNIFAELTPETGTETIVSATLTVCDVSGNEMAGYDALIIVQGGNGGWTALSTSPVQVWFTTSPSSMGLTAGGLYLFKFAVTDSNNIVYTPGILVFVQYPCL